MRILLVHGEDAGARIHDHLFVALERRLEAEVVRDLSILELLEDESDKEHDEKVVLHFELVQHPRQVALRDPADEEDHPGRQTLAR